VADSQDFEALVQIIADRVSERLGVGGAPASRAIIDVRQGSGGCAGACHSCGNREGSCGANAIVAHGASRVTPVGHTRTSPDMARYIDHTLLKPEATHDEIVKLCNEARQYGFATVCVNSSNVGLAAQLLKGSGTVAIAVVGFPSARRCPRPRPSRPARRCAAAPRR
jgi:deoxyribose-phosphate aldolase